MPHLLPLMLTQSVSNRTLPLATREYQGQYGMNAPLVLTVVFYVLQRRTFIQDSTAGAFSYV